MKNTVRQYRSKPKMIYAIQWDGGNEAQVLAFAKGGDAHHNPEFMTISLRTLEGVMTADVGDFIIQGIQGEFYPCKPEIFEKSYEETR